MWQLIITGNKLNLEQIKNNIDPLTTVISLMESPEDPQIWILMIIAPQAIQAEHYKPYLSINEVIVYNDLLPQRDWLAENRASFKPVLVAPFYIYSSLHVGTIPTDMISLNIDASTAFGTGHHETTAGCLKALVWLQQQGHQPNHFLDIGTGTGILAMATARLFDIKGIATDNDPEAICRVRDNLKLNHLDQSILIQLDSDLTQPEVQFFCPYPLIIANILLEPLLVMAPTIVRASQENGHIILSGILTSQAHTLIQTYMELNLKLVHQINDGMWTVLVFKNV